MQAKSVTPTNNHSGNPQEGVDGNLRFNHLFNHYYPRLCLYAYQILSDREDAEDVVQECFTKLWLKRAELDYNIGIATYLYSMVRNHSYNFIRNRRTREKNEHFYETQPEDTGLDKIIKAETYGELYASLQFLPLKCREVFRMLIQGKDYAQISRELNISESTIRTQKAKALSIIKKYVRLLFVLIFFFYL